MRKYEGTGIGLFIVSNFVKLLGGRLELKSKLNEGSVFSIHLPIKLLDDELEVAKEEIAKLDIQGIKILLVEDNIMNQEITKVLFEEMGMQIDIANNGLIGVEKIKETRPSIVFMDVQMPGLDGISATKIVREIDEFIDLPIIGLSADAYSEQKNEGLDAGMDAYITKPLIIKDVVRIFKRFFTR